MAWSEISPDGATWTIPGSRTKNHATHIVPLSAQARAIIAVQPRRNDTAFVFSPGAVDRPLKGFT